MPDDHTDEAERNDRHDDQRLDITLEQAREHHINQSQRERERRTKRVQGLEHFEPLSAELEKSAGIIVLQLGKFAAQVVHDVAGVGDGLIAVGRYRDRSFLVLAHDGGVAGAFLDACHFGKWNQRTRRCSHAHGFDIVNPRAIRPWVAHHDLHVLASALYLHGLESVKRRPHLCGERPCRKAEGACRTEQLDLYLAAAVIRVVDDVIYAGVGRKQVLDSRCRVNQVFQSLSADLHLDGGPAGAAVYGVELQFFHACNVLALVAQHAQNVVTASRAGLAGCQFEEDLGYVGLRRCGLGLVIHLGAE